MSRARRGGAPEDSGSGLQARLSWPGKGHSARSEPNSKKNNDHCRTEEEGREGYTRGTTKRRECLDCGAVTVTHTGLSPGLRAQLCPQSAHHFYFEIGSQ